MIIKAKIRIQTQLNEDLNLKNDNSIGHFYFKSEDLSSFLIYDNDNDEYIIELYLKDRTDSMPVIYSEKLFEELKACLEK